MSAPSHDRAHSSRSSAAPWVGVGVLIVAAVSLWWLFREPEAPIAKAPFVDVATPAAEPPIAAPVPSPPIEKGGDGIPLMAAGSGDRSTDEPRHPHPMTPAHARNFRQISLVAVMNGAMDVGDVEELRRVNRKYRDEYPENTLLQDGYDLIADCLEERTVTTRAAAERYWETAIASNLRRYVRRHCLDSSQGSPEMTSRLGPDARGGPRQSGPRE